MVLIVRHEVVERPLLNLTVSYDRQTDELHELVGQPLANLRVLSCRLKGVPEEPCVLRLEQTTVHKARRHIKDCGDAAVLYHTARRE